MMLHEMLATWLEAGLLLTLGGMLWQVRSQTGQIARLYKKQDQLGQLVIRHDGAIAMLMNESAQKRDPRQNI